VAFGQLDTSHSPKDIIMLENDLVTDMSLIHLVRLPQEPVDGPAALLLLLHGIGSNEQDLFGFADYLDPRCIIMSLRAPFAYPIGGYSWFDLTVNGDRFVVDETQIRMSLERVQALINEACTRYNADPSRVLIGGFSQGGFMSLLTGLSNPKQIMGIVSMSGLLVPEVMQYIAPRSALKGLPILIIHGTRDGIVPISTARKTRELVQTLPVALHYEEFDMDHEVTLASMETMLTWLAEQLENPWQSPAK
jgi:phospholipase/carboxylesterase